MQHEQIVLSENNPGDLMLFGPPEARLGSPFVRSCCFVQLDYIHTVTPGHSFSRAAFSLFRKSSGVCLPFARFW